VFKIPAYLFQAFFLNFQHPALIFPFSKNSSSSTSTLFSHSNPVDFLSKSTSFLLQLKRPLAPNSKGKKARHSAKEFMSLFGRPPTPTWGQF
jgi:hypothetical protein